MPETLGTKETGLPGPLCRDALWSPSGSSPSTTAIDKKNATNQTKKNKKKRKADSLDDAWDVKPVRALAPGRLKYRRGSLRRALRRTRTPQAMEMMRQSYEDRKLAPGSRRAQSAKIAFWTRRARSHGLAAFPLDIEKLKILGGLLFAGAYRSSGSYFSAAKAEHLRLGFPWSEPLSKEVRDGVRSCCRGQGPDKQSDEIDLDALARCTAPVRLRPGWPAAGKDVALAMGCWLLREVEGGTARIADISFAPGVGCGRSTWRLPCSKTDIRALGHARTHGCSCPDAACPTASLRRVVDVARGLAGNKVDSEAPLFPDTAGNFVTKGVMIALFKHLAVLLKKSPKNVTGHMPRVSGARRMARAGVELFQIQLFARWESSVILRYVKEAPLEHSHLIAAKLATPPVETEGHAAAGDFTEIVDDAVDTGKMQAKLGDGWQDALVTEIQAELGGEVMADPKGVQQEIIEKTAMKLIAAEIPQGLPELVLNDSIKGRLRVHRPRCDRFSLCGWPWAEMVSCGVGVILKPAEGEFYSQCGTCLRRARLRGLVEG